LFALAFGLVSCGGKSDPDYPDPGSGGGNSGGGTQEIHKLSRATDDFTDWYYYFQRIISGQMTISSDVGGSIAALPASTGPLFGWDMYVNEGNPDLSGEYYYGVGILAWNENVKSNGKSVVTVKDGANVTSSVTGDGIALATGLHSLQYYGSSSEYNITVNNSGKFDASVTGHDGTAAGVYHYSLYGGARMNNYSTGECMASAPYYSSGIYLMSYFGPVDVYNSGSSTGIATGGNESDTSGKAYSTGIDVFTYDSGSDAPINFENTGTIVAWTTGGSTQKCYGVFLWAEGGEMTLKNSGTINGYNKSDGDGCEAFGVYCGGNRGDDIIINSGTITSGAGGKGGWALGIENDCTDASDEISVTNTGSIYHNNGLGVALFIGTGAATITSSGDIFGGLYGISAQTYEGPITVNINGGSLGSNGPAMCLGKGNDTVNITGLPDITGVLDGYQGTNTLNLNLTGTLEKVNGVSATSGNDLSKYSLSTKGNITVSGKTYSWKNFNVSGVIEE